MSESGADIGICRCLVMFAVARRRVWPGRISAPSVGTRIGAVMAWLDVALSGQRSHGFVIRSAAYFTRI